MSAVFQNGFDTVMLGSAIQIVVTETGGGGGSDTIALNGQFFPSYEAGSTIAGVSWLNLQDQLQVALNASVPLNAAYTVSFDATTGKFTIAASGGGVTAIQIAFSNTATLNALGFSGTVSGALSHTSPIACYYHIVGTEGGISGDYADLYEIDEDLQADLIAYDGSGVDMLARPGAPLGFDFEVPWEPRAKVWTDFSTAALPWTWQRFFAQCRTGAPFVVEVPALRPGFCAMLRASKSAFRPRTAGGGYLGHVSIPIGGYYLGATA